MLLPEGSMTPEERLGALHLIVGRWARQSIEQPDDRALRSGDCAGQIASQVALEAAACRQVGFTREAQRLVRERRQHRPRVSQLDVDRILRRDGDELGLRRPAVLLELLLVPSAGDDQPRPRLHRPRRVLHAAERFFERAHADPVHFRGEAEGGADRVQMGIDQTRNDRSSAEINHPRLRSGQLAHLGRRAKRHDASVANRQRFAHRRLSIDGEDLAVDENRVRTLRAHRHGRQQAEDDIDD
jgi:hypothetical protein